MAETRLKERSLFDPEIARAAIWESFRKLAPQHVIKNPVMFVVEIGSVLTTLILLRDMFSPTQGSQPLWFTFNVSFWLWFTVVFANFAEAMAEGRGKAQAASLRRMRQETTARRLTSSKRDHR
jgi:K+-transporting ATPase ATPase B chain